MGYLNLVSQVTKVQGSPLLEMQQKISFSTPESGPNSKENLMIPINRAMPAIIRQSIFGRGINMTANATTENRMADNISGGN